MMKTFNNSSREDVFSFLEDKIKEADALLGHHEYMMIGSYVRDIHLRRAGIKSPRGTQDLDLSLVAREFADFERALDSFRPPRGVITRRKLGEVPVDIIPFGPIARGGHLEHGDSHWELRGLQEAYDSAELCIIGDSSVKIPQIYAMMGLKIIVWGERAFPTDCTDFHHLLVASCKILDESGELWESPLWEDEDVIEQCEGNPELLAAYSAGRKLAVLFAGVALERCIEILADPGNREVFVITALRDYRDPRTNSNYKKMYEVFFLGIRTI